MNLIVCNKTSFLVIFFISLGLLLLALLYTSSPTLFPCLNPVKLQAEFLSQNDTNNSQDQGRRMLMSRCEHINSQERLQVLAQWCKANDIRGRVQQDMLQPLYVSDQYRTVYCHIPKTGCTNWKKYFILLSGKTNFTEISQIASSDAHSSLFTSTVRSLSSYTAEQQSNILKTYFKFVIVRHPLTRLLSAYRNKFAKRNPTFESFTKKILKYYSRRNNLVKGSRASLEEFLHFVTDPSGVNIQTNVHWQKFHTLCNPCFIQYDFIGQLETMENDSQYILTRLNAPFKFPTQNASSDTLFKKAFADIPSGLVDRVIRSYLDDFNSFGYNC